MPRVDAAPLVGDSVEVTSSPPATLVYATPLPDPTVLLAVPVATRTHQLSVQAAEISQSDGRQRTCDGSAARPVPVRALQRICEAQEQRGVCFRQGIRTCEVCKRWVCPEHVNQLSGPRVCCKACALAQSDEHRAAQRGGGAHRCECWDRQTDRRQTLLCILVCIALFVLFYLGPYRDGRK